MAFPRFPYTNFNQINLDWIMRKIKQLEPAISLIDDVQEAVTEAQEAAAAATAAVDTVTEQAAEALEIAAEAKEIAQDAAEATIVDGSITEDKLSASVKATIQEANTVASQANTNAVNASTVAASAQTTSGAAYTAATNALDTARTAQSTATAAQSTAQAAETTANNALNVAQAAANNIEWSTLGINPAPFERNAYHDYLFEVFATSEPLTRGTFLVPRIMMPNSNGSTLDVGMSLSLVSGPAYFVKFTLSYNDGVITVTPAATIFNCVIYVR